MDTRQIQQALIALHYDLGPAGADGVRGRRTIAAITQFQIDQGLKTTHYGSVGPKTTQALNDALEDAGAGQTKLDGVEDIPWVEELDRRIGLQEVRDNQKLREFLKSDGNTLGDPAKLPWCGDLVETAIALTLPAEPLPANPYYALNWQKFGVALPDDIVPRGAIVTFERRNSAGKLIGGHVGFVVGHDSDYYHVLGGNQMNKISITKIAKKRKHGSLRWPATYRLPTESLPHSTLDATITTNEA